MQKENLFHANKPGKNPPKDVNCLVEIPKGSNNKYEYDKETGTFTLNRVLFESFFYPFEYGLIPQTWNKDDNDPLDILVFLTNPTFPGCLINCRPVGVLYMIDTGEKDDKIVGVPTQDPRFSHINSLDQISPHILKEIEYAFSHYKDLQGKKVEVTGWGNQEKAYKLIEESIKEYQVKFRNSANA